MSSSTAHPRPDHVAELTRGVTLPLSGIEEIHMQIIAEWIAEAWAGLVADYPLQLADGEEVEISVLLESRLNQLLDESGPWSPLVTLVNRSDCINFSGHKLEKKPDLSVHLSGRQRMFPLPVECKILDATKGVGLYCSKGVARFICGDYAWAAREGLMLAYVRDGSTIDPALTDHLENAAGKYLTVSLPLPVAGAGGDLATSRHGRDFTYAVTGQSPGEIVLWHLWLPTIVSGPAC